MGLCVNGGRAGWWATLLADCLRLNKRYRKSSPAGICLQTSYLLSITNHPSIFSLDHNTHTNASLDSFLLLFLRRASSFHVSSSSSSSTAALSSVFAACFCCLRRRTAITFWPVFAHGRLSNTGRPLVFH
jgi:hypothetical protein